MIYFMALALGLGLGVPLAVVGAGMGQGKAAASALEGRFPLVSTLLRRRLIDVTLQKGDRHAIDTLPGTSMRSTANSPTSPTMGVMRRTPNSWRA